jgi:hypothetical protein
MHISSSVLVFKIGPNSLRCEGLSVWHELVWSSQGRYSEIFLGDLLFIAVGLASSGSSEYNNVGEQPRQRPTSLSVCGLRLVARVVVCALTTVLLHDSRRGYIYQVLVGFLLSRRSILFFLINKNGKPFCSFKKITLGYNVTQLVYNIRHKHNNSDADLSHQALELFYFT